MGPKKYITILDTVKNKYDRIIFVTFTFALIAIALAYFAMPAAAGTNLMANPGFESGSTVPVNWKFVASNGNTPVWDTTSHSGARSIKISIPGTTKSNSGYPLSDKINVEPLQTYTLSAWIKSQGVTGGPTLRVVQYDANSIKLSQVNLEFSRGTNDWVQKQMDIQTLSNTAFVMVYANIWSGYGTFWMDDIGLSSTTASSPAPTPTAQATPTPTQTPITTSISGTNFMANPGFESGSTVPVNWKFVASNGNTPVWDTTSHSGARSIKISIPGTTKSNSGYPLSDKINVEPLQTYTLSAWIKSQGVTGGPTLRVVQYDANSIKLSQVNLEFSRGTNDWVQKQMDIQTLSNTAFVMVYANIWSGYGTFWMDDIGLSSTTASSPAPIPTAQATPTPTPTPKLTPTPTGEAIRINTDKTLNVNGKKTFPVYMYGICNTYFEVHNGGMVEPCDPLKNSEFLFSAGASEFYQYFDQLNYKNKFEQANVFYNFNAIDVDNIPQELKTSPYFFGYYQPDEPVDSQLSTHISYYNKIKAKEPNHLVIQNHYRDMKMWAQASDIITWDVYTIRETYPSYVREDSIYVYEQFSEQNFFKGTNINLISKPVWAVIQANGLKEGDRVVPTPKEARANTYTAITMDVKGIGFWSYLGWGGSSEPTSEYPNGTTGLYNDPSLHSYYKQLGRELKSLNDILVLPSKDYSWQYRKGTMVSFSKNPTKTVLWKSREALNYILKQDGQTWYLIVVNKDSKPINDVKLTINGLTGAMSSKTLGLETSGSGRAGRVLNVNNGQFTDSFDGYAVHIYKVS